MKMKTPMEKIKIVAFLAMIAAVSVGVLSANTSTNISGTNGAQVKLFVSGPFVQVIDDKGNVVSEHYNHNLLTTLGVNLLKTCMGNMTACNIINITVGNATGAGQAVGDTTLNGGAAGTEYGNCNLAPAAGMYVSTGNGIWNVTYQWTTNCNNVYINSTGIYNQTGSAQLFAETDWATADLLQNGYKYNVTWGFQQNAG